MKKQDNVIIGIYKITSPSGKIYIGQSVDIKERKRRYKQLNCLKQHGIYNSLKKYGFENHIFEIIEECSIELLNERERYWQDYYEVLKYGLNCVLTNTNDLPRKYSEESRIKIGDANRGTKRSKEFCENLRIKNTGFKMTDEAKKSISEAKKGHKCYENLWKKIIKLDLNGNFIDKFRTAKEASMSINKLNGSNCICACARGEQLTAYGFKWKYEEK